jgi:hypothetical protein
MKTVQCGFTGQDAINRLTGDGPTVLVDIGFDHSWRPGKIPVPNDRDIVALIDTGARECFIDVDLAGHLQLPVVDRCEVAGSHGRHEVDVYLAQIHIPALVFTQYGKFAGAYLQRGSLQYEVLMGRTFLENFTLMYDGRSGRVTLTG